MGRNRIARCSMRREREAAKTAAERSDYAAFLHSYAPGVEDKLLSHLFGRAAMFARHQGTKGKLETIKKRHGVGRGESMFAGIGDKAALFGDLVEVLALRRALIDGTLTDLEQSARGKIKRVEMNENGQPVEEIIKFVEVGGFWFLDSRDLVTGPQPKGETHGGSDTPESAFEKARMATSNGNYAEFFRCYAPSERGNLLKNALNEVSVEFMFGEPTSDEDKKRKMKLAEIKKEFKVEDSDDGPKIPDSIDKVRLFEELINFIEPTERKEFLVEGKLYDLQRTARGWLRMGTSTQLSIIEFVRINGHWYLDASNLGYLNTLS